MVLIIDSTGRQVSRFRTYPAVSLGVLRNGNVVVASPVRERFLHIYSPAGRLLKSYGVIENYSLPSTDDAEKMFLRRGKVVIDATDNVYYIFNYVPLIQKYSRTGKLKFEREVRGRAINLQQELAQSFLTSKAPGAVGGIDIIRSGAIDAKTGHLWLCMNGSSVSGVVYEYSERGEKIREYALRHNSPLSSMRRITGVKDIALTKSSLYALTAYGHVLSFNIRDDSTWTPDDGDMTIQDADCGTGQTWADCPFTCPGLTCNAGQPTATSSDGSMIDCKAALQSILQPGWTLKSSTCTTYAPGTTGPPPHMRGGCKDDAVVCYNGVNSSVSTTIDCPTPTNTCPTVAEGRQYNNCNDGLDNDQDWYTDYDDEGCLTSPIIIDVGGNGFHLSGLSDPVIFDFDGNRKPLTMAWTARGEDDAFLALDRNGNGTIDNSMELFGNTTPQPQSPNRNGFLALAEYDKVENGGNGDGAIDSRDAIFASLRLWQDINHNGVSEPVELHTLPELGIASIDLDFKLSERQDTNGNRFRFRANVRDAQGARRGRWAYDVFLVFQH
jgi:hypothetical protein